MSDAIIEPFDDTANLSITSPLHFLLSKLPIDDLMNFVQVLRLRYKQSFEYDGKYKAQVAGYGTVWYFGQHPNSPKFALCEALSKFLVQEQSHYLEYVQPNDKQISARFNMTAKQKRQRVRLFVKAQPR